MNKAQGYEPNGGNMEELQAPGLSRLRVNFQSQDNQDPRLWSCIPRPYESNEPKNTSFRARMKKRRPKYYGRNQLRTRTSVRPVRSYYATVPNLTTTGMTTRSYRRQEVRIVKQININEGLEAISSAGPLGTQN